MPNNIYPEDPSTEPGIRMDVPQNQKYMDMNETKGVDPKAANDDFVKSVLTPGGQMKKAADSVGSGNPSTSTSVASVPNQGDDL